jgi:2-dehydro-3-deoxygluconokinase
MLDETVFRGCRLAIVGSICRDVKIGAIRPGRYLLEDGETPTTFVKETIGGGGANSALAAASLAAEVRFCGKVGADSLGERLEQSLVRQGVTSFIRRDSRAPTGSSVVLSFESGYRHFISWQPNNYSLAMSDIDLTMLLGAEHLLRADVWFSEPMLAGGNEELFRAARARGLTTSLDLNWDPYWGSAEAAAIAGRKEAVRRILPLVDLVHGNVRELNQFADCSELEATLRQITAWGARAIVIHMGIDGAGYYCRGQLTVSPAIQVEQCMNTAGSGDLLSVCMMLLHGRSEIALSDRLWLANTIVSEFIAGKRCVIPELA